jgi:hypothetical protein
VIKERVGLLHLRTLSRFRKITGLAVGGKGDGEKMSDML